MFKICYVGGEGGKVEWQSEELSKAVEAMVGLKHPRCVILCSQAPPGCPRSMLGVNVRKEGDP